MRPGFVLRKVAATENIIGIETLLLIVDCQDSVMEVLPLTDPEGHAGTMRFSKIQGTTKFMLYYLENLYEVICPS